MKLARLYTALQAERPFTPHPARCVRCGNTLDLCPGHDGTEEDDATEGTDPE